MSWSFRFRKRSEMPEGLWMRCDGCTKLVFKQAVVERHSVCPECDHHFRLGADDRIALLADPDSFREFDADIAGTDPLNFTAKKAYGEKLSKARTLTGHLVTIPNMKFIDTPVENIAARPSIRRSMNVTITYDTPPNKIEQAVQILRDILNEDEITEPFDMQAFVPRVYFTELNADSLNVLAIYWFMLEDGRGYWDYLDHAHRINMKLFRAYEQADIEFAFPTQTLYLAGDQNRKLSVEVTQAAAKPPAHQAAKPKVAKKSKSKR